MTTPDLLIHLLGDWPAERLHATMGASGLQLTPELEAQIARTWGDAGRQPGVNLFDGPLCRLEQAVADSAGLHLHLSRTSYRVFIGTNGRHPCWADEYGPQVMANPIGTSVVLRSSDGRLVFGRRSARVALYPGCIHPFGGTMEPPQSGKAPDVLAEMRRELLEEAGIAASDLSDLRVIALVEDHRLRQPELVYAAWARLSAEAIQARLDADEHTACHLLDDQREAIERMFANAETKTPVFSGTLLAWGWRCFGDRWLDQHLGDVNALRMPGARSG